MPREIVVYVPRGVVGIDLTKDRSHYAVQQKMGIVERCIRDEELSLFIFSQIPSWILSDEERREALVSYREIEGLKNEVRIIIDKDIEIEAPIKQNPDGMRCEN